MSLSKNEIKFIKSLQQKKFRDQEKLFVVEGIKLVKELMESDLFQVDCIYHLEDCELHLPNQFNVAMITGKDLERISGLRSPNQVLATVRYHEEESIELAKEGCILLLDDIRDPGNLGTIIRTADWFGIEQIICSTTSVDKYNPKVVQSSMGSIFRVQISYQDLEKTIAELKTADFSVFGADMDGKNAFETDFTTKTALVMGSESHGISQEVRSTVQAITIPKKGHVESLNVAMATGILLAEINR